VSELVASHIQQAREHLVRRREEIRQMHQAGATGGQVVAALTVLVDGAVDQLAMAAVAELDAADAALFRSGMALVALGGYGRAELAPFSDVDLMFLYQPEARRVAQRLCERLVRDFWDAGLALGWSMRTLAECVALARRDIPIHTALWEARNVVGNPWLTDELRSRIGRLSRGRRGESFIAAALAERSAEQAKAGANLHLLEPDVKKSKGGLRELHLMRWVAWARHGAASIDRLEREALLSPEDASLLAASREFLLRVRNELHFHAGRSVDTLTWNEQVRLAAAFGFQDRPGMLAVEQFMQQYYRHAAALDEMTGRFIERCRSRPLWHELVRAFTTQRLGGEYRLCGGELAPTAEALPAITRSLQRVVELFALANRKRAVVAGPAREQIRRAASGLPRGHDDFLAARRTFLEMLAEPGSLGPTLRQLDAAGLLEILIPEFAHAHSLIQFNQYHKYTVDEHTLICVSTAEQLERQRGPIGQVYREIHHKEILHLAILLHDLGKGFDEDHSELGRRIALETAERFELDPHRRDLLVFLVHRHLLMAHLAFRRDTSDEQLLDRFARQVGTPEALKMLFAFTAADIASVGPDTWTSWKGDVLAELYARTMQRLSGGVPTLDPERHAQDVRRRVAGTLDGTVPADWLGPHLEAMTRHYLLTTPLERIIEHLSNLHALPAGDVRTTATYDPQTRITGYTVYTFDNITPGLFSKIAGVLAAKGLQILGAQISTHQDGVVVDRFDVLDYDYDGEPPRARLDDVRATIRDVLLGRRSIESVFAGSGRVGPRYQPPPGKEPTQVLIDNDTSDRFTIIEVFANDRQGLLYVIARTIFELGLSVSLAKIATSLDQVLDVFYVADMAGHKVTDEMRQSEIRSRLVQAIEAFESMETTRKP
jgi:[protein-PII] uridylyltransferase